MCLGRRDFRASLLNRADRALTRSDLKKLLGFGAPPVGAASSRDLTPIAAGSRSHGGFCDRF